jgi:hypothetical protein
MVAVQCALAHCTVVAVRSAASALTLIGDRAEGSPCRRTGRIVDDKSLTMAPFLYVGCCHLPSPTAGMGERWLLRTYNVLYPVIPWSRDGYHVLGLEHAEDVTLESLMMMLCGNSNTTARPGR